MTVPQSRFRRVAEMLPAARRFAGERREGKGKWRRK